MQLRTRPYEQVTVTVNILHSQQDLTATIDHEQADVLSEPAREAAP